MVDWLQWHGDYDDPNSALSRRVEVVRMRIAQVLDRAPAGPIRVVSICAGEGRDLLPVLQTHPRARDVSGRLVELDSRLAERARASAPATIDVFCGNAGASDAYEGAIPVDLLLCCGVFGNITEADIQNTIECWSMLCAPQATVIWTRHTREPDLTPQIRQWIREAGFEELSFDGGSEKYGVGAAKMIRSSQPYRRGVHFFSFVPERRGK